MKYVNIAIFTNIDNLLTYKIDSQENLVGRRVIVPLANKYITGLVIEEVVQNKIKIEESKIKEIKEIIDDERILSDEMIRLGLWVANYYLSSPGVVFSTMLSPLAKSKSKTKIILNDIEIDYRQLNKNELKIIDFLKTCRKKKADIKNIEKKIGIKNISKIIKSLKDKNIVNVETIIKVKDVKTEIDDIYIGSGVTKDIELNEEQKLAYNSIKVAIDSGKYKGFLLMGITGSGKTEIYIKASEYAVSKGKKVIVLVPEIFLTPQIMERFKGVFKERIAIYHSGLSDKQRLSEWNR
ncbi:MAG: DEAD/DEAH box helicase family protein, partial [Candidatus Goldbacteria bacterium]|nr:DEAD/DEAH box helicase family protein [Candidatus Goldiibacteriota bacterium]